MVLLALCIFGSCNRSKIQCGLRAVVFLGSRLSEKFADQALLFFVFDTGKEFLAEPVDCLGFVEWHRIVDTTALKMAGHAT
jgi:hypothetical protein